MKLEIERMLIISTAHIKEETNSLLEREDLEYLSVYPNEYGYFIYTDKQTIDEIKDNIPKDLLACINFAIDNRCKWLRLDCDGMEINELNTYEW